MVLLRALAVLATFIQAGQGSAPIAPSTAAARAARLDAVIEDDLGLFVMEKGAGTFASVSSCAIPFLAARIAQAVAMPAGIEHAPICDASQKLPQDARRISFAGLTAREALGRLIATDPRYHWTDTNGVVVFRTIEASGNRLHFLHRTSPSFHMDAPNFAAALSAVQAALGPYRLSSSDRSELGGRTPQGSRPISVHLDTATSAYEALNSIVGTHGAMRWRIDYCRPEARREHAMIWMETYDGSALGSRPAAIDASGKSFDACRPQ